MIARGQKRHRRALVEVAGAELGVAGAELGELTRVDSNVAPADAIHPAAKRFVLLTDRTAVDDLGEVGTHAEVARNPLIAAQSSPYAHDMKVIPGTDRNLLVVFSSTMGYFVNSGVLLHVLNGAHFRNLNTNTPPRATQVVATSATEAFGWKDGGTYQDLTRYTYVDNLLSSTDYWMMPNAYDGSLAAYDGEWLIFGTGQAIDPTTLTAEIPTPVGTYLAEGFLVSDPARDRVHVAPWPTLDDTEPVQLIRFDRNGFTELDRVQVHETGKAKELAQCRTGALALVRKPRRFPSDAYESPDYWLHLVPSSVFSTL